MEDRHIEVLEAASKAVEEALRAGADVAEAFVQQGRQRLVRTHAGTTDFVKESRVRGVGLRVVADGRRGFVHASEVRDGLVSLARRAVHLARLAPEDPWAALPHDDFATHDEDLDLYDAAVAEVSADDLLQRALTMEQAALRVDERVQRTQLCQAQAFDETRALVSSNGAAMQYRSTLLATHVGALAVDADGKQQGWYEGGVWRHASDAADPRRLGAEAARQAVRRLGPRRVEAQRVPVVMHPDIVVRWLDNVARAFSGDAVRRKTSWLAERLGTTIAPASVTLVDDARRRRGAGSAPFDAEGVRTRRTALIDAGVCGAFLYDDGAARRAATRSTGNARRDYDAPPQVGPHQLVLAPGDSDLQQLLDVPRGFYYVDSGSFGYNPTTGDYAFQASGFWIDHGELAFPIDEITVASNSLEMLRNINAIGRDIEWRGTTCAPALRVAEMTVGA